MDLLIVSSSNNKYFVVGSSSPFWNRLEKAIKSEKKTSQNFFNVEFVKDLTTLVPGKTNQIRIVDLVGTYIQDKGLVPTPLIKLADSQVTAVSFVGGITATYYQKKGRFWEKIDTTKIISLGDQPDSAKFAAIFSENGKSYQCNMMKVFRRMQYLNEIYGGTTGSVGGKLKEILSYYQKPTAENKNECQLILHKQKTTNIQNILQRIKGATSTCIVSGYSTCSDVLKPAQELKRLNKELQSKSCIQLY